VTGWGGDFGSSDPGLRGPVLAAHEGKRSASVAAYWRARATGRPETARARRLATGDDAGTLAPDEARALLASPATRLIPLASFAEAHVPLVGHDARFAGPGEDPLGVSPAGLVLLIRWAGGERAVAVPDANDDPAVRSAAVAVPDPGAPGGERRLAARRGSPLALLGRCATRLSRAVPWRPCDALWFLLVGEPPVDPLQVSTEARPGTSLPLIRIEGESWLGAATVAEAWRQAQRATVGPLGRPVGDRTLLLLSFVAEQELAAGKRPPWRVLLQRWNDGWPMLAYTDVRNLASDHRRALTILIGTHGAGNDGSGDDPPGA
jgi:hypothetical protein